MNSERFLAHYEQIVDAPDSIARLRRFILDLAVRGKLVPQNPNDEPTVDLLTRITAEKARLVKAGEIRDKPASGEVSASEKPFEVPGSWRWIRFANLVDFSAGRTPSRSDPSFWDSGEYAWVSIADMANGQTLMTTRETVSDHARERVFGSEPEPVGTIIMSFKLTIGKIARLGIPAFHNEAIISIRPHLADLDPYLFNVLPQFARQGDTKGAIKGATLNRESISNILLPLPPLAEQRRIVAKVDELMTLCDHLEASRTEREVARDRLAAASLARLNTPDPDTFADDARFALDALPALTTRSDQIKQLRQTILNLAAGGKLIGKDLLAGREAEWEMVQLSDVLVTLQTGPFGSSLHQSDYQLGGTPVINPASLQDGRIVPIDKMAVGDTVLQRLSSFRVRLGDIVMARRGEMGRCAVVTTAEDGWLCGTGSLILRPKGHVSPHYLALIISSPKARAYLEGAAVGATMQNLNQSILMRLEFALPSLAEQHRIVAKVNELLAICDQLEASLDTTATTRRRLLDALLAEALAPAARELEAAE